VCCVVCRVRCAWAARAHDLLTSHDLLTMGWLCWAGLGWAVLGCAGLCWAVLGSWVLGFLVSGALAFLSLGFLGFLGFLGSWVSWVSCVLGFLGAFNLCFSLRYLKPDLQG
jgi:hypothetical protein